MQSTCGWQTPVPGYDEVVTSVGAYWLSPWSEGQVHQNDRVTIRLFEGTQEHTYMTGGTWPSPGILADQILLKADVVVSEEIAYEYSLIALNNNGLRLRERWSKDPA